MAHTVVLTLAAGGRDYTTADEAQTVLDRFGATDDQIRKVDDGRSTEWHITCAEQRGPRGAFALHSLACAHRILVHVA